jgi:hypothetical protein
VTQIARNVTYVDDGFLCGKAYLILDRDTKYSEAFRNVLLAARHTRSTRGGPRATR